MVSLEGSTCQVLHFCRGRPRLDAAKVLVGRRRIRGAQVGDGDGELEDGEGLWHRQRVAAAKPQAPFCKAGPQRQGCFPPRPPSQLGAREAAPDAVCGAGSNGCRSLEAFPQVRPMVRAV